MDEVNGTPASKSLPLAAPPPQMQPQPQSTPRPLELPRGLTLSPSLKSPACLARPAFPQTRLEDGSSSSFGRHERRGIQGDVRSWAGTVDDISERRATSHGVDSSQISLRGANGA